MGRVGRQSDPGREVRPEGSPRLHLLVCVSCWRCPWDCACEGKKRTKDKQHVTAPGWRRVRVHTAGDVRAALELVGIDRDAAHAVVEALTTTAEEPARRRSSRASERPGARREAGRLLA